jgi:hypothetical protein
LVAAEDFCDFFNVQKSDFLAELRYSQGGVGLAEAHNLRGNAEPMKTPMA